METPCTRGCRPGWVDCTSTSPEQMLSLSPPRPPAQLSSLHQEAILWLNLENGSGAGTRTCLFERYSYMHSEKSSLLFIVTMFRSKACLRRFIVVN